MATITQKIEGFSLENILQIFSLEKKSQTLRVHKEDRTGLLDIDQGELIDAEIETLQGLEAATEILLWDDVQIELLPLRPRARAIDRSLINILLEVSRLKDERRSTLDESGQTLLAGAIDKAQLLQYREAHQDLVQYLRQHFATTHHQQRLLEAQCLDHTRLGAAGQTQLPLATAGQCRRRRRGRARSRGNRRGGCRRGRHDLGLAAGQRIQ